MADVFDALLSRRPYKEPWPREKALQLIRDEAGRHFDPRMARIFLDHLDQILAIQSRL